MKPAMHAPESGYLQASAIGDIGFASVIRPSLSPASRALAGRHEALLAQAADDIPRKLFHDSEGAPDMRNSSRLGEASVLEAPSAIGPCFDRSIALVSVYPNNVPGTAGTFNERWTGDDDEAFEECVQVEDLSGISFAATPSVHGIRRAVSGVDQARRTAEGLAAAAGKTKHTRDTRACAARRARHSQCLVCTRKHAHRASSHHSLHVNDDAMRPC